MAGLYLKRPSDLPPEIPKKKRSKVHIAIYMTKLMNLMYLALKHRRSEALKFESFESLVLNREFVRSVLTKASTDPELTSEDPTEYYLEKFTSLMYRDYKHVLAWLDDVWDLTLSKFGAVYPLLSLPEGPMGIISWESAGISGSGRPLRLRVPKFQALFLEALLNSPGTLTKSTIYLGSSSKNPEINLDLAVRLPLKNEDLETAFRYQQSYGKYYLVNENFEVYPFLLRARRISYGRIGEGGPVDKLLQGIINSRFVPPSTFEDIIHGDFPLDVLLMMPHIYLNDALSFLVAFKGKQEEPLLVGKTVRVLISEDLFITAFRSGTAVLPVNMRPGSYIYIAAIPVTYPKTASILATLDESKFSVSESKSVFYNPPKRHRKRFMCLAELLSRW